MGVIRLQSAAKQYGGQVVLADVSLELHTGQVAALVGANGVGKTTLLRMIAGQVPPDTGTVTLSRGLEVGYLPQEPDIAAGATLREAVAEAFADLIALERRLEGLGHDIAAQHDAPHGGELLAQYDRLRGRFEAAGGYAFEQRLGEVLGGLGFGPAEYGLPVKALSGGQKCRAALARLLLRGVLASSPPFLLLDEPTNHLDIDAVRWLERFLAAHHGGAVVVSHDRYLLDRLAERVIELVAPGQAPPGQQVRSYPGNYSNYAQTKALRQLTEQRQYEQDQAFIAKERDFAARYGAAQRTKQAQGRLKRLERAIASGELSTQRPADAPQAARLDFSATDAKAARQRQSGRAIVQCAGLRKQYGDKLLFADLSLDVWGGQRLGITGPNGTGKTTLLRIVLGEAAADEGTARLAPTARVGYFAQEPGELDPQHTIVQEIQALRPDLLERDARHVAARFLFTGEEPFKRLGQLSGGEQSRVRFMKLILQAPDVLVLDEPTNHLDIASREALEAALAEFPGTVVAVSHDRYFLDRIAQQLLVLRADGHQLYPGNYSYYVARVEQARAAEEAAAAARAEQARQARGRGAAGGSGGARKAKAGSGEAGGRRSPLARLKLEELEAYITAREALVARLQERFGDAAVYRDPAAIMQLRADFDAARAELAAAEAEWLARAEKH